MTAQHVRRHPKGAPCGGQFAPSPAPAAAAVASPEHETEEWDAVLRPSGGQERAETASVVAAGPVAALEAAHTVLAGGRPWTGPGTTGVERDRTGRMWHVAATKLDNRRLAVSLAAFRGSVKPFTSAAGGLKARFEYHDNDGWGYTAGEERVNLADCPATNVIADTERQRMALGQVCADLLNEGRITRVELPKFHGALIRSTKAPYRPPAFTGDLDTLLSAYARAGCAAQIAALLPGNEYDPTMWAQNDSPGASFMPTKTRNTSGLPLPPAWREFVPHPATLAEAVETAPPCSTPADGTLLGSVHHRRGADPELDCLGAWAAQTVRGQEQLFVYGIGYSSPFMDDGVGLNCMPLSIISRSPETLEHGKKGGLRGRIPCGTVEALLFMLPDIQQRSDPLLCAEVQAAAARRSELAAHLAVGGMLPATHVVDALLDDPRSDWCATESEFRRKIVTAAVSQTAEHSDSLSPRADRLIAEHVIGGPSEEVTEMELRCLRTVLNRRVCQLMREDDKQMHTDDESYYPIDAYETLRLAGSSRMAAEGGYPLPETAARVTSRLGAYTRAVNRLRKRGTKEASAGRLFLQTLLTLPGLPLKNRAELLTFERIVTSDLYRNALPYDLKNMC